MSDFTLLKVVQFHHTISVHSTAYLVPSHHQRTSHIAQLLFRCIFHVVRYLLHFPCHKFEFTEWLEVLRCEGSLTKKYNPRKETGIVRQIISTQVRKGNLPVIILQLQLMYSLNLVRKHLNWLFKDFLYGGVGNPYICSCFSQTPCWVLTEVGIECLHCFVRKWRSPSISFVSTALQIVKVFYPSGDSNVGRRDILELTYRNFFNGWYGLIF